MAMVTASLGVLSDSVEISHNQLAAILLDVNTSLVMVIKRLIAAGQFNFSTSDYQTWNSAGARTTDETVRSLAQLYQRKLQAAPLPSNFILSDSRFQEVEEVYWTYDSGDYYHGEAVNGKRHGHGIYIHSSGGHYEGNWVRGEREGYGRQVWADGASYTGEWKDGAHHGHGLYIWPSGESYNGDWVNHVKHGQGIVTRADGTTHMVIWKNGKQWNP